ncbi:hypothetical protein C6A37_00895 [Desulfobacteraceae bacterium SEEP-SAG9]|nr:hypothetical protein C6A37_00895 [Desulfobacteraceae bacterium SEEP-SAG9]
MNVFVMAGQVRGDFQMDVDIDGNTILNEIGANCSGFIKPKICGIQDQTVTLPVRTKVDALTYGVGTTNFDYRSRLLQSEVGFYFQGQALYEDLNNIVTDLKSKSHLWGTAEWLEMRKRLMSQDGMKASSARKQRGIFKTLRDTGLGWLF